MSLISPIVVASFSTMSIREGIVWFPFRVGREASLQPDLLLYVNTPTIASVLYQGFTAAKNLARPSSISNSSAMSKLLGFLRSNMLVERVRIMRLPLRGSLVARATDGK